MRSGIYAGAVIHERLRPKRHRLRYSVFCLLIDLDEFSLLDGHSALFAINRPAIFSFREGDHGDGRGMLKDWAARLLIHNGIAYDGGRIDLLCYPRLLGYVFNPLSVYFCHDRAGTLVGILYEVHNTHGERHTYVMRAEPGQPVVRHSAAKAFFVSPFMPMDCVYRFRISPPMAGVGISILEDDAEGLLLTAAFTGERREITSALWWRLLLGYPLMTLKVVAGIHFEAVKLLAKGMPFFRWHPAANRIAVSVPQPHRDLEGSSAE
jgi:DUF1365 family protein